MPLSFSIGLPAWLEELYAQRQALAFRTDEEKMSLAIELASRNVKENSGGPFGSAIFDECQQKLISVGVNRVVAEHSSIAHAEMLAIALAQKEVGQYQLGGKGRGYALYASGQPCIMCYGAVWWSGITKLVCAARAKDIEDITGFREGPLPENWVDVLKHRLDLPGIETKQDLMRQEACQVLHDYVASRQPIYNAGGVHSAQKNS